jgi:hypothetical protein
MQYIHAVFNTYAYAHVGSLMPARSTRRLPTATPCRGKPGPRPAPLPTCGPTFLPPLYPGPPPPGGAPAPLRLAKRIDWAGRIRALVLSRYRSSKADGCQSPGPIGTRNVVVENGHGHGHGLTVTVPMCTGRQCTDMASPSARAAMHTGRRSLFRCASGHIWAKKI